MPKPISLAQQIEEVEREIKLRESAFQSYGRTGKMRSSEVEFHIVRMRAVLTTLRWLGDDQGCGDKRRITRMGRCTMLRRGPWLLSKDKVDQTVDYVRDASKSKSL